MVSAFIADVDADLIRNHQVLQCHNISKKDELLTIRETQMVGSVRSETDAELLPWK